MNIISIIPARGGSKGIPQKNIRELCGKPLICYSIAASLESKLISDTVVSTDDLTIANISEGMGVEVVMRPPKLSGDKSPVIDAIKHVISTRLEIGKNYEYAVLLEPTSPIRRSIDIDKTIELVIKTNADSGATFSETRTPPGRIWKIDNFKPSPFIVGSKPFLPRQAHETGYFLNGMVYVNKVPQLMSTKGDSLMIGNSVASIVPATNVVDIDTLEDLKYAEFLLLNNK